MSQSTILAWKPVYGDRAVHYAETAIGVFRTRAAGRRCVLSLNDVRIGNHGDAARARRQAERLIEATAAHLMGRARRQAAAPAPPQPEPPA